jgi:hypothetical protein
MGLKLPDLGSLRAIHAASFVGVTNNRVIGSIHDSRSLGLPRCGFLKLGVKIEMAANIPEGE